MLDTRSTPDCSRKLLGRIPGKHPSFKFQVSNL